MAGPVSRGASRRALALFWLVAGCGLGPGDRLPDGPWSGPDVLLVAGPDSSLLHVPCRLGVIREPLVLDDGRRFSVPIVLAFRGGVPPTAPASPSPSAEPGRLEGRLRGARLELTLTAASPDFPADFVLLHRSGPPPPPCPLPAGSR